MAKEYMQAGTVELYDAHALIQRADFAKMRTDGYDPEAFWPRGLSEWPDRRICKVIEILAHPNAGLLDMQITFRDRQGETWGQEYSYHGAYAIQWADEPYEEEDGITSQRSVIASTPGGNGASGQHGAVATTSQAT